MIDLKWDGIGNRVSIIPSASSTFLSKLLNKKTSNVFRDIYGDNTACSRHISIEPAFDVLIVLIVGLTFIRAVNKLARGKTFMAAFTAFHIIYKANIFADSLQEYRYLELRIFCELFPRLQPRL